MISQNAYLSVPINKPLDVLIDQLNNDKDDFMKRTKLCLRSTLGCETSWKPFKKDERCFLFYLKSSFCS